MNESLQGKINDYYPSEATVEAMRDVPTDIFVGISNAGKDTIAREVLSKSDAYQKVITTTTRAPRQNNGVQERDGVDYYFLTPEQAEQKINDGEYAEVAAVHEHVYGSLLAEYQRVAKLGKRALAVLDYQGAERFLSFGMHDLNVYFIVPPSFEVLLARTVKRGSADDLITRFKTADNELAVALDDKRFVPIINDVSQETADNIIEFSAHHTKPTDEAVALGHQTIQNLRSAISSYIRQIEE